LPGGASFAAATGTFTWTPNFGVAGDSTAIFKVTDGEFTVYDTVKITVIKNHPPVWAARPDTFTRASEQLIFVISATDPDGHALTYKMEKAPLGARFIAASRGFSWMPADKKVDYDTVAVFSVNDGAGAIYDTVKITVKTRVDVASLRPTRTELRGNYPNPFNPSTTLRYSLATEGRVSLVVYNALGQPVRTLVDDNQPAGYYTVVWNGTDETGRAVASGMYLVRMVSGDVVQVHRMMLVK